MVALLIETPNHAGLFDKHGHICQITVFLYKVAIHGRVVHQAMMIQNCMAGDGLSH